MDHVFRATAHVHNVGDQLPLMPKRPPEEFDQPDLERVLEAACPDDHFSRRSAYYAFPHADWSIGFYATQGRSATFTAKYTAKMNLYALDAEVAMSVPYALVHQISRMLQSDQRDVAEALSHEYWQADDVWTFREILLPTAFVVGVEQVPTDTELLVTRTKKALEQDRLRAEARVIAVGGKLVSPFSAR